MLRLRSLTIHRFRQVVPESRLEFCEGQNLLLGMNGVGKTTLLDLLVAVVRGEFEALTAYDLDVEISLLLEDPIRGPQNLILRVQHDALVPASPGTYRPEPRWSVEGVATSQAIGELRISTSSDNSLIRFAPGGASSHRFQWPSQPLPEALHFAWASLARAWPQEVRGASGTLFSGWWLQSRHLGRLGEDLQTWEAVVDGKAPNSPLLTPPVVLSVDEADTWYGHPFRPGEIAHGWRLPDVSFPSPAFLQKLQALLGIQDLTLRPRFQREAAGTRGQRVRTYAGMDLRILWSDGSVTSQDYLSCGQKRLFAILYALASTPEGMVIADELVGGLHPEMVEICLEAIDDRQAILASQDPLLFDHLGFESAEHVRRALILCRLETASDGQRSFNYRNPTEEEAWSFFRLYRLGTRHVSEILQSMGLW